MKIRILTKEENELNNNNKKIEEPKSDFIKEFINNTVRKFITFNDMLCLSTTKLKSEKTETLAKYLKEYISVVNKDLYVYSEDTKIHYKINSLIDTDEFLKSYLITYCETSYKKLDDKKKVIVKRPLFRKINN